ncbi:universal stress protein [Roseibacillus ishigakijimensis]|uniref:Universal stress protein n=1 Tax=Roseibacillus ishigakijimensis TaxID=454146 RepID=A0A934VG72_9BACT|nr:universal stress protein [Roseibacillus ishigakijimensis]MBK1832533.1 universal stress protein [Roseibacillus ishigakijimensis]
MKRILAAIDFSDVSSEVLAQTAALAQATGAQVTLVHGIEQLAAFYDIYGYTIPDVTSFETHARQRAQKALEERAQELQLSPDRYQTRVLTGPLVDSLIDCAREIDADLIVLGSHGHGIVARMLLGSTAQRIVNEAVLPSLIVPA